MENLRAGPANGLACQRIGPDGLRELEPHVAGIAGINVPTPASPTTRRSPAVCGTGEQRGGASFGTRVTGVRHEPERAVLSKPPPATSRPTFVNCAGLHSDRIARGGGRTGRQIVPFRGEYYELNPAHGRSCRPDLPRPDPAFPFLGVHFTRMIDGAVDAARTPCSRWGAKATGAGVNLRDLFETLTYRGSAARRKHFGKGMRDVAIAQQVPVRQSAATLVPEIPGELVPPTPVFEPRP